MSWSLDLTAAAQDDIATILGVSASTFGDRARQRYADLIATGLADLRDDPVRAGCVERPELHLGTCTYHLRNSRRRSATRSARVGTPRHLILFRLEAGQVIVVLRVLHDAMELSNWIEPGEHP